MAVSTKIIDFFDRRAVSAKRALRHQRDLAVTAREQWRKLANDLAKDCETFRAERDEARAQLGFATEEIARLMRALESARQRAFAAMRDAERARDELCETTVRPPVDLPEADAVD